MLFTTGVFLLLFLPVVLIGFYAVGARSPTAAVAWLFAASLFFYGYWMPELTWLLLLSIAFNFGLGRQISLAVAGRRSSKALLVFGLAVNLCLLAYFKYAGFFVQNLNAALEFDWDVGKIVLPIGISFYTFTQIAFLVDAYQGKVNEPKFLHYGLFVTYFPHLIAGPVLHHAQMMPQFASPSIFKPRSAMIAGGLVIFAIGLFKKVVLADGIAPYSDAVFNAAQAGQLPTTVEAWTGALAYTLQLYFDFSGYSDMAVGLSHMFNVRLPFNFDSPYQARSISDFWRRWHISLSTFLRDYLYIPLGGNRYGAWRRYGNLATTMVLGGLWHGAGWTFVLWGALHGAYLMVNHAWRGVLGSRVRYLDEQRIYRWASWVLTLLSVVVAWVFFRAETVESAGLIIRSMAGLGTEQATHAILWNAGLSLNTAAGWCLVLGAIALFAPNSNRLGDAALDWLHRTPNRVAMPAGAATVVVGMLLLINSLRDSVSAFIYFNF